MSLRNGGGRFDLDLTHGVIAEDVVEQCFREPGYLEIKRQDRALEFGSFYIETEHDPGARGKYRDSGLRITAATFWGIVVKQERIFLIDIDWLKAREHECRRAAQANGSCPTRGFRLPVLWLLKP
jgi:hypothetical protein